jgi:hypothetical protein
MLTKFRPLLMAVAGTTRLDAFERPGEPVGVRHLCPEAVQAFYGIELEPLQSIRVRLAIQPVPEKTPLPVGYPNVARI